jgi:hypothetical protein
MTPHDWFIGSPTSSRPIAVRTLLRAPSQPTTYVARIVDVSPVGCPAARCCSVTVAPSGSTRTSLACRP